MPLTHEVKYPVVDPDPDARKAIANFRLSDYGTIAGFGAAGFTFGWFSARKPFRAFNSRHTLAVGLVGGFLYSLMRSTQRLVGLEPNDVEVARLGFIPSEILQETEKKREMRNLNMIDYKTAELSATKKDE